MIYLPKVKLGLVTVLAIASFTNNQAPGLTQFSSQVIADLPSSPGTGTSDNKRTPGITRTEQTDSKLPEACKQTAKAFTALVPLKGSESLTTAEYPIFWFYIPDAPDDVHSIEFSVHDRHEKTTLYRTSLQLTKTPGVIGIPLPPSPEHSLKVNESYHWRLIVNCARTETSENVLELDGWVTRVQQSPNLVGAIWYDELTNRAQRFLLEPQNPQVKKAWTELLKSVGLEEVAQAPVVSALTNPSQP
jgi:hypothetical protein